MPGIAAKFFVHLQDWTSPLACPEAEAVVFALLDAEVEAFVASLAGPEAESQGIGEPRADELAGALDELGGLADGEGHLDEATDAGPELDQFAAEPAVFEAGGGVSTIFSISEADADVDEVGGEAELPNADAVPEVNCQEASMILYLLNDNVVKLKNFRNKATTPVTYLNAATVTAALFTEDDPPPGGTPVVSALTLNHDGGTDGTYLATWDKDVLSPGGNDLEEGQYILQYIAVEGTVDLQKHVLVEVRYRTEDLSDS